jgi:site-specific DNA recombinase
MRKIDRLTRKRADDVAVNADITRAGANLVSVAEPVDDSPSGKLRYSVMAGVAQYHSDNLAAEVLESMDTKAERGGTPYRAPLGYLNHRQSVDGADVRTVIVDEERHH